MNRDGQCKKTTQTSASGNSAVKFGRVAGREVEPDSIGAVESKCCKGASRLTPPCQTRGLPAAPATVSATSTARFPLFGFIDGQASIARTAERCLSDSAELSARSLGELLGPDEIGIESNRFLRLVSRLLQNTGGGPPMLDGLSIGVFKFGVRRSIVGAEFQSLLNSS